MIWLSLPGCHLLVLSGRVSVPDHLFQPFAAPWIAGARVCAARLQKKWIKRGRSGTNRPWGEGRDPQAALATGSLALGLC